MTARAATSRRSRRLRFGAWSFTLIVAATASFALAAAIADRYALRFDVTATREHSLAERTQSILDQLDRTVEIVLIADDRMIDPRARRRIGDVLDAFEQSSAHVSVTRVNPVSDAGRETFEALQSRVRGLYEADLAKRRKATAESAAGADRLVTQLESLSDLLLSLKPALSDAGDPLADEVENVAAVARLQARALRPVAEQAHAALNAGSGSVESARTALAGALASQRDQLAGFAAELAGAAAQVEAGSPIEEGWRRAQRLAESGRDLAARHADALERLGRSEADVVLRILQTADAVLILSEGKSTAIPFASLFPTTERLNESGGTATDLRFIGEELITTAIASLTRPTTPVVVLVHNLPGRLLTDSGEASSSQARQVIGAMLDRLSLRGMRAAEWPVAISAARPSLLTINPDGARPVVWLSFGTEGTSAEAASRFDAYARALESLIADGESVLVSLAPSTRPASGGTDPAAAALKPLGVNAATGKPLIRRIRTATGAAFDLSFILRRSASEHPIASAISGLPTTFTWATPLTIAENADAVPILNIEDSPDVWAEAEWLSHANMPDDRPWASAAAPTPNDTFDIVAGPWTIGVAIERILPPGASRQRIVTIGSPGWFFDRLAHRTGTSEGRTISLSPGNHELLEASIYWLAGQDEMIAPSARTADIPRIGPMSDAQLALIRYALIFGLPAGVLALGVLMRFTVLR